MAKATLLNFTKESIEALRTPPAGERAVYQDSGKKAKQGLQLRITSNGVKTFSLYRWVKASGRPERITLGRFPDMTVELARKEAGRLATEIEHGANPAEMARRRRGEPTVGALFELYVERHLRPKGKRVDPIREDYQRYLGEMPDAPRKKHGKKRQKSKGAVNWHHRGISSITKKEIQRLMESLRDKAGPVAANHALSILRAMYNKAIEWEVFDKANPAAAIDKYEVASRERFLKREELQRFFKVLSEEPNANARDFVLLSLYTGARRRTVGAMRWQDIDLDARLWFVAGKITKTKKPYVVPLSMPAVALLRARMPKDADGWVFPSAKAKSGHIEDPRKPWERVRKNAGITDVILHDLRRTLGSWQAITGSSLPIIGKSLGHKDAQSTEVYAHLVVDPVRQSVETATNAMLVAAGVKATAEVKPLKKRRAA